ncbi:MAG: beta-ketoacyl synthase chain length factor [Candidatus Competibacteraceae bacterium]|nr:beta-ketoacyl synthase chain length factor [Candidatus Competibacteraceae bacterium]
MTGQAPYQSSPIPRPNPTLLNRNALRRATFTVRLALHVAQAALIGMESPPNQLASVFACSGGDTDALDQVFTALIQPERPVSPNQFNNSVHNAPAGYWSIATGSRAPSISLSAYDASFTAGLLEAGGLVCSTNQTVLLVAYDVPPPPPLQPFRPIHDPFAVALLLTPERVGSSCCYLQNVAIVRNQLEVSLTDDGLEALRVGNPAARSLPLLQCMARRVSKTVLLPYLPDTQVRLHHQPC